MSGFEFTPYGIVPLGTSLPQMADGAIAGATADVAPPPAVQHPAQLAALQAAMQSRAPVTLHHPEAATAPLRPADVLKLARARLREIEREIRRLKKLEPERDELKRLLDAGKHKPAPKLRSLPTRSA